MVGLGMEGRELDRRGERTYTEPVDDVAVCWVSCAACELFIAGGVDDDGVVERSCVFENTM